MKRLLGIMLLSILPVLVAVSPARAGHWNAARLPYTGAWYRGEAVYRVATLIERSSRFEAGYYAVYAAEAWPGADYSFGLRYEDELNRPVRVALYDRWPLAPGAKRYNLPMGPVLKGDKTVRYRWRFSISPRSPEGDLFIIVEARGRGHSRLWPFRHRVMLLSPAVEPGDLRGRGVTYLRGPQDLILAPVAQEDFGFSTVLVPVYDDGRPREPITEDRVIPGDLIRNGDFRAGLLHWQSTLADETERAGFSVGKNGLRLFGENKPFRAGVVQRLYTEVADAEVLRLELDLRILAERPGDPICDGDTPVFVTVCYEDRRGTVHCAERALRRAWSTIPSDKPCRLRRVVQKARWVHFSEDLLRLDPAPWIVRTISVEGGGPPGRDAEVREVHLVKRGGAVWHARP